MVSKLIAWAVHNPLIVLLLGLSLAGVGSYAFLHVNVESFAVVAAPRLALTAAAAADNYPPLATPVSFRLRLQRIPAHG